MNEQESKKGDMLMSNVKKLDFEYDDYSIDDCGNEDEERKIGTLYSINFTSENGTKVYYGNSLADAASQVDKV